MTYFELGRKVVVTVNLHIRVVDEVEAEAEDDYWKNLAMDSIHDSPFVRVEVVKIAR